MQVLVIGLGSIGKRHATLLRQKGVEVWAYDPEVKVYEGITPLERPEQIPALNGVVVSSPNHTHGEWMKAFKDHHLFVEKPLVADQFQLKGLEDVSFSKSVSVAANYYFHPTMQEMMSTLRQGALGRPFYGRLYFGHYLPYWRPGRDYRQVYSSRRAEGGGVFLDTMSHHLFWIDALFGPLTRVEGQFYSDHGLEMDVEDMATVHVVTQGGMCFDCHMNYLDQCRRFMVEIVGEKGTLVWEEEMKGVPIEKLTLFESNRNVRKGIYQVDPNKAFQAQMDHWLRCVSGEVTPVHGLKKAMELTSILLEVHERGRWHS